MRDATDSDTHAALSGRLSYAQVWEDEAVLRAALRVGPGQHVLSIASGGDNAIALALAGARVTALDLSLPQLALTELKLAAGQLAYEDFLFFLGANSPLPRGAQVGVSAHLARQRAARQTHYRALRLALSAPARAFWDAHPGLLSQGVLHAGRLERFLAAFRQWVLPAIHRRTTVDVLLSHHDIEAQRRFYRERWDGARWRLLFQLFFSRHLVARFGRSRAHFQHVEGAVAERLHARAEWALCHLPAAHNPYLEWMLTGGYRAPEQARAYLSREGHAELAGARERLRLVHAELGAHLATTSEHFDAFNLSNLFEYVSAEQHAALLRQLVARARPGARLAYWNLFVPRFRPDSLADRLERREAEAARLHAQDRAFLYGAFQLEVVR